MRPCCEGVDYDSSYQDRIFLLYSPQALRHQCHMQRIPYATFALFEVDIRVKVSFYVVLEVDIYIYLRIRSTTSEAHRIIKFVELTRLSPYSEHCTTVLLYIFHLDSQHCFQLDVLKRNIGRYTPDNRCMIGLPTLLCRGNLSLDQSSNFHAFRLGDSAALSTDPSHPLFCDDRSYHRLLPPASQLLVAAPSFRIRPRSWH